MNKGIRYSRTLCRQLGETGSVRRLDTSSTSGESKLARALGGFKTLKNRLKAVGLTGQLTAVFVERLNLTRRQASSQSAGNQLEQRPPDLPDIWRRSQPGAK
jgi:hypothetical protein